MRAKEKKISDELHPEYNFDYSKAVRGKYYKRLLDEGANVEPYDLVKNLIEKCPGSGKGELSMMAEEILRERFKHEF